MLVTALFRWLFRTKENLKRAVSPWKTKRGYPFPSGFTIACGVEITSFPCADLHDPSSNVKENVTQCKTLHSQALSSLSSFRAIYCLFPQIFLLFPSCKKSPSLTLYGPRVLHNHLKITSTECESICQAVYCLSHCFIECSQPQRADTLIAPILLMRKLMFTVVR